MTKIRMRWFLMAIVAVLAVNAPARAHPLDLALLILEPRDDGASVRLEINPAIEAKFLGVDPASLDASAAERRAPELFSATLGRSRLEIGGTSCRWDGAAIARLESAQVLSVTANAICPERTGRLRLELPFLAGLDRTYRLLATSRLGGTEQVSGADPENREIRWDIAEASMGFGRFMWMGVEHIGLAPGEWRGPRGFHLPYGIDHILFVLALLLGGESLLKLGRTITGFTIGHTLSLTLASFGLVQCSARWIEALIAATIALVAAENLIKKKTSQHWKVALGIGLIHGLGFATALGDLHLGTSRLLEAVFGFNLGVEAAQATLIAVLFPLGIACYRWNRGFGYVKPAASILIFVAGTYWFAQRAGIHL